MSTHKYLNEVGLGLFWEKVKGLIPESDIFLVTITQDQTSSTGYRSNKTYNEVINAINNGKIIVGTLLNSYFTTYSINSSAQNIQFVYTRLNQVRQYVLSSTSTEVSYTSRNIQQKLTFDSTPTENSTNPVTSGGVYEALNELNVINVIDVLFVNASGIGDAIVGTSVVGDEILETDISYQNIYDANNEETIIYFQYYDYYGQAYKNSDGSFSAICFKSNDLEKTDGIKIIYKSDGTITSSRIYIPVPEDDENILNLLTEYGYSAPLSDIDGNVITDVDRNLILG